MRWQRSLVKAATSRSVAFLGRGEVASSAAAEGVSDGDVLFDATEGNPLFVVEMYASARDRGGASSGAGVASGWRSRCHPRASRLALARARALLDAGSVLGRTLDSGIIASLVEQPIAVVRDLAVEAVRSNALATRGSNRRSLTS